MVNSMITDEYVVRYNTQPPDRARSKKDLWFEIISAAALNKWVQIMPLKEKGYLSTEVSTWNTNQAWGKGVFVSLRWLYDPDAKYYVVWAIKRQEQGK